MIEAWARGSSLFSKKGFGPSAKIGQENFSNVRQILFHQIPISPHIDRLIVMSNGITEGDQSGEIDRRVSGDEFRRKSFDGLPNRIQAKADGVQERVVLFQVAKARPFRIGDNPVDVSDDLFNIITIVLRFIHRFSSRFS